MSNFSKTELKFLEENREMFAALLAKQKEIEQKINALAENQKIRQYKDPIKQQRHLENKIAEKNKRANMIKRIMKKLNETTVGDIPVDLSVVDSDSDDTPYENEEISKTSELVGLDKKTLDSLRKIMK